MTKYNLTFLNLIYSGYVKYARLGDLDIRSNYDDADPQEFEIDPNVILKHPNYSTKSKYNDLGLIKMTKPARLNPYVRPACLFTSDTLKNQKGIATGWGKQDYAGDESGSLLKVVLDMYTNQQCNDSYDIETKLADGIINTQVCAGSLTDERKDTCQVSAVTFII